MNREILFRAKRKNNGEWVEGDAIHEPIGMSIRHEKNGMSVRVPVDPDTLCQYTGLTDKNGNKIWENDIVYIRSNGLSGKGTIQYKEGCLVLVDEKRERTYNLYGEWKIRKDGNIFDNAELLEE